MAKEHNAYQARIESVRAKHGNTNTIERVLYRSQISYTLPLKQYLTAAAQLLTSSISPPPLMRQLAAEFNKSKASAAISPRWRGYGEWRGFLAFLDDKYANRKENIKLSSIEANIHNASSSLPRAARGVQPVPEVSGKGALYIAILLISVINVFVLCTGFLWSNLRNQKAYINWATR